MKKIHIFWLLILLQSSCNFNVYESGGKLVIRPKVQSVVDSLAELDVYASKSVGFSGKNSIEWEYFELLNNLATDEELVVLTDHKVPAVRIYSFKALTSRKYKFSFEILLKHLSDTQEVITNSGCMAGFPSKTNFLFLENVTCAKNVFAEDEAIELTQRECCELNRFQNHNRKIELSPKTDSLLKLFPDENDYEKVRSFYLNENKFEGLILLSRYRKEKDKQFIINSLSSDSKIELYFGLWAARNFPDGDFFQYIYPILLIDLNNNYENDYDLIRMLYQAYVRNNNKEAVNYLDIALQGTKGYKLEYHREYLWLALKKYPDSTYNDIIKSLNINEWNKNQLKYWLDYTEY
jgi:hypothetical protein